MLSAALKFDAFANVFLIIMVVVMVMMMTMMTMMILMMMNPSMSTTDLPHKYRRQTRSSIQMPGLERTDPDRGHDRSDPSRPSRDPPAKSFPIPLSLGCDVDYGRTDEGLVGITTVVCIAFAAFAIGVLLIGSLWLIHSRTGGPGSMFMYFNVSVDSVIL